MSLSDWLHSVWQSLGLPMLLQIALFCSFLWLSNILLHIRATSSLSISQSKSDSLHLCFQTILLTTEDAFFLHVLYWWCSACPFSLILMIYNINHNNDQVKRLLRSSYSKIACGCVLVCQSCLPLYKPMDCSHQASLSMEFSRQEW